MNTFGCACGACEITTEGAPATQFYCHCASCRQAQCGQFMSVAVFPKDQVKVTKGEPKGFQKCGKANRYFCPDCGVRMMVNPRE